MPKKALIFASFGSTHTEALKTTQKIENQIKATHKNYDFFRTFTSRKVIKKLKEESNISVLNPTELMEQLVAEGYDCCVCQPLFVIPGIEVDKLNSELQPFAAKFKKFSVGTPLLSAASDIYACKDVILKHTPPLKSDELLLLMGHGTKHPANDVYSILEDIFRTEELKNVLVGTVEGLTNFDDTLKRLSTCNNNKTIRKIYLMPFMLVAGDHVKNDMPQWQATLEKKGFEVCPILHTLGEFDETGALFAQCH